MNLFGVIGRVPYWVGLINSMCRSKKKEWLTTLEVVWEVDATDFRLWRNGGGSMLAAAHSLRECGVGCLLTIGIGQHRWACTCLRSVAVDATDSRPSRSGGATVPVAARRLRACQRWRTGAVGSQTSEIR